MFLTSAEDTVIWPHTSDFEVSMISPFGVIPIYVMDTGRLTATATDTPTPASPPAALTMIAFASAFR